MNNVSITEEERQKFINEYDENQYIIREEEINFIKSYPNIPLEKPEYVSKIWWYVFNHDKGMIQADIVEIPNDLYNVAYKIFSWDKRLIKDHERHYKKGHRRPIRFDNEIFINELSEIRCIV
jgi:hypothetical protein